MNIGSSIGCAFAIALIFSVSLQAQPSPIPSPAPRALPSNIARPDGIEVERGQLLLRATALTDDIVRVRVGRDGSLPEDASWAVPREMRESHVAVTALPNGFATRSVRVIIDPATLKLTVTDLSGNLVVADADQPISLNGRAFTLRKALPPGEHIYGLGDKTGGSLDRRSKSYVDWNTDAYGFDSSTDPIYKSIPFFIASGGSGGSYGILLDNSWRTFFDFAHAAPNILAMGGPDGPIDYYIVTGPSLRQVVRRYTDLTGKAPLPPEWESSSTQTASWT